MLLAYLFVTLLSVALVLMLCMPKNGVGIVGVGSIAGISCISIAACAEALLPSGSVLEFAHYTHTLFGELNITCDGLSAWFVVLVSFVFIVGSIYGIGYLNHYDRRTGQTKLHWISLLLTYIGMIVMFLTDNMILFLLGWEFMAIGSFFAVIFESEKPLVLKAGLNYFIQSHIAVLLLTTAFVWIYSVSGTLSFEGFKIFMEQASSTEALSLMALLTAGFGFKAGLIPFHTWLPYAHPAAPSHISALMSGVIVKAGIYGIIRFGSYFMLRDDSTTTIIGIGLLLLGVLSGLFGIINAAVHRDFKRMLAYCTIENVGIITMGIGVGFIGYGEGNHFVANLGLCAALLHTVNHAIFKALLFFGAGNVYVATHTRNMEELGGLAKVMPKTAITFLIGALAIGGLPPFGGFVSELVLYFSFIKGFTMSNLGVPVAMVLSGACLAVIGGLSMLAFTKSFGVIFLGEERKQHTHLPHEASKVMLIPGYILIGAIVLIVIFASQLFVTVSNMTTSLYGLKLMGDEINQMIRFTDMLGSLSMILIAFGALVAGLIYIRRTILKKRSVTYSGTWGCGYMRPIKGIQYTSKSFARTMIDLFKILLPSSTRYKEITTEEIFPKDRGHMTSDSDFFEKRVINPATGGLLHGLDKFQFIQNGNLQLYIVYGLAWIIVLILTMAFI